jgi:DNA invertase Pin-like site-specific DNA recombinase
MPQRTQTVGYVRVSSDDQNLARQLEAVGEVDRLFSDKVSGASRDSRAALDECIKYIRDGDTVRVASMDRLARSLRDMRDIVDEIVGKGAAVQFVKEGQTYSPDTNDALSQLRESFAPRGSAVWRYVLAKAPQVRLTSPRDSTQSTASTTGHTRRK